MLSPAQPVFEPQDQPFRSPVTQEVAEAINDVVNPRNLPQTGRRRRPDTSPRARRKKDHRDDDHTLMRINRLGIDEQHIMKDYAGNTVESRMETLSRLEQYRMQHKAPPIKAVGKLGPKKGKTDVDWICALCQEHKNTFQKIAGHITSHHWKLKVWTCLDPSCGRKYRSLNELTRHKKESHKRKAEAPITQYKQSIQSTANPLHDNTTVTPINYQSSSTYLEAPPSVTASHSTLSPQPPSERFIRSPEPTLDHNLVKRTSARLKALRVSPYPHLSRKSVDSGSQASARVSETRFLPRNSTSSRIQQNASHDYHDSSMASTIRYHDRSRSDSDHEYSSAHKASYYPTSRSFSSDTGNLAVPQSTTSPTAGTTDHVSLGSHTLGRDSSIHFDSIAAPGYVIDDYRGAEHHLSLSGARHSTTETPYFQPQNRAYPLAKYSHNDGWAVDNDSYRVGSAAAAYPPGPDHLDSIPSSVAYDINRRYYSDHGWYTSPHHYQSQSGAGSFDNPLSSCTEPYVGEQSYVIYGDGYNQDGATMAAQDHYRSY